MKAICIRITSHCNKQLKRVNLQIDISCVCVRSVTSQRGGTLDVRDAEAGLNLCRCAAGVAPCGLVPGETGSRQRSSPVGRSSGLDSVLPTVET